MMPVPGSRMPIMLEPHIDMLTLTYFVFNVGTTLLLKTSICTPVTSFIERKSQISGACTFVITAELHQL